MVPIGIEIACCPSMRPAKRAGMEAIDSSRLGGVRGGDGKKPAGGLALRLGHWVNGKLVRDAGYTYYPFDKDRN
jgi:hypothetical protein